MANDPPSLPRVLSGEMNEIHDAHAGRIAVFFDGPLSESAEHDREQTPLLLIHSINASASAHEIKPLFDAYKQHCRVYALDLPGYGHSDRSERTYDQEMMVNAITAVINDICEKTSTESIDVLAVSLSCEFVAKAALDIPSSIRSLALVSPTGFAKIAETKGPPEANCGRAGVLRFLKRPVVGKALFKLLSSAPSVRFFLKKTWGSKNIDEQMFHTSCQMARYPGAEHAPFHFLSGYLFSADILSIFKILPQPVWLSHGIRGDFTDFSKKGAITEKPNWTVTEFDTGALPYFEIPELFTRSYDAFLRSTRGSR